ncbi:hypothetical protein ACR2V0_28980, partial [Klebsiella pneumoniae]
TGSHPLSLSLSLSLSLNLSLSIDTFSRKKSTATVTIWDRAGELERDDVEISEDTERLKW